MASRPSPTNAIEQHNKEIHENLRHWERKPALRREYLRFYQHIAARLTDLPDGPVLECGSGIGILKTVLPDAITSDLFPNPWLDRQENIYALSYANESLGETVLFDVFHHLRYPGTALRELVRVLKPLRLGHAPARRQISSATFAGWVSTVDSTFHTHRIA